MLIALSTTAHLIAAIIFLSTLFIVLFFLLTMKKQRETVPILKPMEKQIQFLQQISFGVLLITGMHLMLVDANYVGWFSVRNRWSVLLLLKHILIGILILILGVSSIVVSTLQRQSLIVEDSQKILQLNRWQRWIKISQFIIAAIILLISASLITL